MKLLGSLVGSVCCVALISACGGYVGPPPESLEDPLFPSATVTASTAPAVPSAAPSAGAKPTPSRAATASAPPGLACTAIGGSSTLTIGGDRAIRDSFVKVDVTLRQGSVKRTTSFPGTISVDGRGILIDEMVYAMPQGYVMTLASDSAPGVWPNRWKAEDPATVIVVGRDGEGRPLYRKRETFTFETTYPNGQECDKVPYLSHTVRLAPRDKV